MSKQKPSKSSDVTKHAPQTPEDAMEVWKAPIDELPKVPFDETKRMLRSAMAIAIPDKILRPEGYVRLLGKLQQMRARILHRRSLIKENHDYRQRAVKNLQTVYQGMADRKTVREREAEAETWLIYLQRSLANFEALLEMAEDAYDAVNRATADIVQQLKAINQYGVQTGMLDTSMAIEGDEFDFEDEEGLVRTLSQQDDPEESKEEPEEESTSTTEDVQW